MRSVINWSEVLVKGTHVVNFGTHAEGWDRPAHGELPLGLAKDQNRPPCVQIHLEGTR